MKVLLKNWLYRSSKQAAFNAHCLMAMGVVLLKPFAAKAQVNMVVNGGFEQYSGCPTDANQYYLAAGWDTLRAGGGGGGGGGGPTYLNACVKQVTGIYNVSVPFNSFGFQLPHGGEAYMLFTVFVSDSSNYLQRDYLQGELKSKLIAGKQYCVTFYVNLADVPSSGSYAIDEYGAYFDDGTVKAPPPAGALNLVPQVKSPRVGSEGGSYLTDTLNWMKIQGSYTAVGTEQYITLGNFRDYHNTNFKIVNNCPISNCAGNYYIDDISVIEVNTKANAGRDTTIKKGDSTFVGVHDIGDTYTWYANGKSFYTGSEAGLYVSPTITTTYVVQQTVCSVITYDTCVITVKYTGINELKALEGVKVWPNPVNNGVLHIEWLNNTDNIELYNILGEKVLKTKAVESIDVSGLPKGLYFLKIHNASGNRTFKIVVQ